MLAVIIFVLLASFIYFMIKEKSNIQSSIKYSENLFETEIKKLEGGVKETKDYFESEISRVEGLFTKSNQPTQTSEPVKPEEKK